MENLERIKNKSWIACGAEESHNRVGSEYTEQNRSKSL